MRFDTMFYRVKRGSLLTATIAGALGVNVLFASGASAQPAGSHDKPNGPTIYQREPAANPGLRLLLWALSPLAPEEML